MPHVQQNRVQTPEEMMQQAAMPQKLFTSPTEDDSNMRNIFTKLDFDYVDGGQMQNVVRITQDISNNEAILGSDRGESDVELSIPQENEKYNISVLKDLDAQSNLVQHTETRQNNVVMHTQNEMLIQEPESVFIDKQQHSERISINKMPALSKV